MPFDTTGKYFYGAEAKRIWKTTRDAFMNTLRGALNDAASDLQATIGKPVTVTPSDQLAGLLYDNDSDEAIVYVMRGQRDERTWGCKIGATFYEGTRYEIHLTIDFSMGAQSNPADSPVDESEADQDLADALCYYIRAYCSAFEAIGLHNIEIEPDEENQRAGVGRNPHKVSFLAFGLPTYNPTP